MDSHRLFKRGEPWAICAAALATGPQTTKELALALMRAKGMDLGDTVLAKAIGHLSFPRIISARSDDAIRTRLVW